MLITSQGRAAGIHLIAATQYPSIEVVPGRVKVNCGVRIAFYMPSAAASMTILDTGEACNLPNVKGRCIVDNGGHEARTVQAPLILDTDIVHIIGMAKHEYAETSDDLRETADLPRVKAWNESDVITACVEWLNGGLSGQNLHRMLGDESPGERHLNTMCKRIIDRGAANNGVIEHGGRTYAVRQNPRGKGKVLVPVSSDRTDGSDGIGVGVLALAPVGTASEPSQPLDGSAAD